MTSSDEFEVRLTDLRFHAFHGVDPQEKKVGGEYIVDLIFTVPFNNTDFGDNLSLTVSYADVYELVATEMKKKSDLIEHAAWRIGNSLAANFPAISSAEVTIRKVTPPVTGITGSASVTWRKRFY